MEALYTKLYNKYTKLKNEKETDLDKLNRDQEEKFMNYATVADEMIQYLKSENDRLCRQVGELKGEISSIRSSNDEQQKLLKEENQKNKELSEEIARLKKFESNEDTSGESFTKLSKKRKPIHTTEGTITAYADVELDHPTNQHVYGDKGSGAPPSIIQPACCRRKIYSSGGEGTETSSVNCVFQHLVEFVVGMKVSPLTQSNEICILANHTSSGYSFSLTWITNSHGQMELVYRALSLGTFERVAPEWMKETLIFSTSMCSVFFERISRVIKS